MNTFAKLMTLTLATVLMSTGLATAGTILDHVDDRSESIDVFNDFADSLDERPEIEIRHTEGPNPLLHNDVTDAVLRQDRAKLNLVLKSGRLVLKCSASSDDVLVANAGNIDLPAGTKLSWKVAASGDKGVAKLTQELEAGQKVRLADVLDEDVAKGTSCAAKVTGL